jgi:hypothetical protein
MDTHQQPSSPVGIHQAFDALCERQFNQAESGSAAPAPTKVLKLTGRLSNEALKEFVVKIAHMRKDGEQGVDMESDDAVETMNSLISQARSLMSIESPFASFGYYINLNERGCFEADVRNLEGKSVFELKSGLSLPRGASDLIEDGFMKHAHDINGLERHLKNLQVIPEGSKLFSSRAFEELS